MRSCFIPSWSQPSPPQGERESTNGRCRSLRDFIGIAPQVEGPDYEALRERQSIREEGRTSSRIDERPYAYALDHARSERSALEGQIEVERRTIAAQNSGIGVAQAGTRNAEANVDRAAASVDEAKASVGNAQAGLARAEADLAYATSNLHRIEPLLAQQFVTVDQGGSSKNLRDNTPSGR